MEGWRERGGGDGERRERCCINRVTVASASHSVCSVCVYVYVPSYICVCMLMMEQNVFLSGNLSQVCEIVCIVCACVCV